MIDYVVWGCIIAAVLLIFVSFSLVDDYMEDAECEDIRSEIKVNGYGSIRHKMMKSITTETLYLIKDFDVFFNDGEAM